MRLPLDKEVDSLDFLRVLLTLAIGFLAYVALR